MQVSDRQALAVFCVGLISGISWSAAMWSSSDVAFEFALVFAAMLVGLGVIAKAGEYWIKREDRRRERWADEDEAKQRLQSRLLH